MITKEELNQKIDEAKEKEYNLKDIHFNDQEYQQKKFYSRKNGVDRTAIQDYSHFIDDLPPIIINQDKIGIDGKHRYKAHQSANKETIEAKMIELDTSDIKLAGLLIDLRNGVRHPESDIKQVCRDYFDAKDHRVNAKLAEQLGISQQTFSSYTQDLQKERLEQINEGVLNSLITPVKGTDDSGKEYFYFMDGKEIAREYLFFKKDKDIGKEIPNNSRVFQIKKDFLETLKDYLLFRSIKFYSKNKAKIDENLKLLQPSNFKFYTENGAKIDENLIYLILANANMSFLKDFFNFLDFDSKQILLYNIWNEAKGDSKDTFGHFPMRFAKNLLYYYTEPFDLVYDPFAGSGTFVDACRFMYRRCVATDRKPPGNRKNEILEWDIQEGLPNWLPSKIDFVFLDPPYWQQAKEKYSDSEDDLGNMDYETFHKTMEKFVKLLVSKKVQKIAYVNKPIWEVKNKEWKWIDPFYDFNDIVKKQYDIASRYSLPYSTEQHNSIWVNRAKEARRPLVLTRELVVYEIRRK